MSRYLVDDIIKLRPLLESNLLISQTSAKDIEKKNEKEKEEEEWDDFGDEDESEESNHNEEKEKNEEGNEELFRLELEVQDFIEVLTGRFLELGTLSGLSNKVLNKNNGCRNNLLDEKERNIAESNNNGIENTGNVFGVVARSVASFLSRRQLQLQHSTSSSHTTLSNVALHTKFYNFIGDNEKVQGKEVTGEKRGNDDILSAFEFIESPLQVMKRAGLDLLSTGWGRYRTVLCCTVLYCTVLCCTVLYCTVRYYAVLYCNVMYCNVM